jgi:hypothetical protein
VSSERAGTQLDCIVAQDRISRPERLRRSGRLDLQIGGAASKDSRGHLAFQRDPDPRQQPEHRVQRLGLRHRGNDLGVGDLLGRAEGPRVG